MPRTVSASVVKASELKGEGVRGGSVYAGVIARRRVVDGAGSAWPGHLDMTLHKISSISLGSHAARSHTETRFTCQRHTSLGELGRETNAAQAH
jgi:hypothetical protein